MAPRRQMAHSRMCCAIHCTYMLHAHALEPTPLCMPSHSTIYTGLRQAITSWPLLGLVGSSNRTSIKWKWTDPSAGALINNSNRDLRRRLSNDAATLVAGVFLFLARERTKQKPHAQPLPASG
jgi:hypothetical protein